MLMLNWPLVLITTVVLYALIIITLPFNAVYATLFLFALIGFWSRLPGVGIPHPGLFLYMADLIDVFSIIIALNLGGFAAASFVTFGNLWSRACGVFPEWLGVMKDTVGQSITCFLMPVIYAFLGGNLVMVAIAYTIIREIFFLSFTVFLPTRSLVHQIMTEIGVLSSLIIINSLYMKLFGSFFDDLLGKGVTFSWPLFLFATAVILVLYITFFRKSKNININASLGKVVKRVKKINNKKKQPKKTDSQFDDVNRIKEMLR
jgi:hypothetical protein